MKRSRFYLALCLIILSVVLLKNTAAAYAIPADVNSLEITVLNAPDEYFLSLLDKSNALDYVTDYIETIDNTVVAEEPWAQMYFAAKEYVDAEGFRLFAPYSAGAVNADYFGTDLGNGERKHTFTCYRGDQLPNDFKIILVASDGSIQESNQVISRGAFGTYLYFDAASGEVKSTDQWKVLVNPISCVLLTLAVGTVCYFLWQFPPQKAWLILISPAVSAALALLCYLYVDFLNVLYVYIILLLLESVFCIWRLRPRSAKSVFIYVISANFTSLFLGVLLQKEIWSSLLDSYISWWY